MVIYKGKKIKLDEFHARGYVDENDDEFVVKAKKMAYEAECDYGYSFATTPDAAIEGAKKLIDDNTFDWQGSSLE
jgi:hypothetical protein